MHTQGMNRRDFMYGLSAAALALSLPKLKHLTKSDRMGVVVHSYGKRFNTDNGSQKYPAFRNAVDLMNHCHELGAGGVQVGLRGWTDDFSGKVRALREQLGMYLEGSVRLPGDKEDVSRFESEIKQAKEAGASVVRTVCLGGRRYETFDTLEDFKAFRANAIRSLELAEPVVRKIKIKLAVENHKDWRVPELTAIMKHLSSEWMGVTLDFGNSVALLEDPLTTAKGLAPYIFSTHVKDMGVKEYEDGFLLSEVPLGNGLCDLQQMIDICKAHNPEVHFNLEMITRDPLKVPCLSDKYWATFEDLSGRPLAKTLKLVRTNSYPGDLPTISQLDQEGQLAVEEDNVVKCLQYSRDRLGLAAGK
jgi:sugar phosphate isomerase/epimerase